MKLLHQKSVKKIAIINFSIMLIFIAIFLTITIHQNKEYSQIYNENVNKIINNVLKEYPNIQEKEIIEIINSEENVQENILKKYGYDEQISNLKEMKIAMNKNIIFNTTCLVVFMLLSITIYIIYLYKENKKIEEINSYLKETNNGNYSLKIEDNGEGELSRLRNELYKTTVLLKEAAERSTKEKEQLSDSLADISHQLKTPLTSIRIMLDNIVDNPEMDRSTREEFIRDISNQIEWISSLVISLLKMAKFDAGTIKMENTEINVNKLINEVINNLSILLEIKEIEPVIEIDDNVTIIADYKWQLEALTNIVKNAIEHSNNNSKIYITVENNSLFLKIKITDTGKGISKKDIKHIFERFYKTQGDKEENIGIGLSLAKTIIEKNNGYITVESVAGSGTTFEIKYLK